MSNFSTPWFSLVLYLSMVIAQNGSSNFTGIIIYQIMSPVTFNTPYTSFNIIQYLPSVCLRSIHLTIVIVNLLTQFLQWVFSSIVNFKIMLLRSVIDYVGAWLVCWPVHFLSKTDNCTLWHFFSISPYGASSYSRVFSNYYYFIRFTLPKMDCDQTAIGLPPVALAVFLIAKSFWSNVCLGGISEIPLLLL
jgi:hypothetical protein